ncbi:DUF2806 domain-containing protein [Spirosoma fluviale]|uniref:DUF2806 domain-containing protein n=1 Tax=Spirosoma fluviale TaxID=1597977 RepID=A0A286G4U5_9BACT|nr:DUF2806 domain-containing protein [Spirosoma fluviale]SOD90159.1 Protein of unknown function [Spirosoma fluviale]
MDNSLPDFSPENLSKAGEVIKQTASYLKLADIVRNVLGERATLLLFRKKSSLEVERAQQLAEVELSKKFIEKSIDQFTSTDEGKYLMNAVGASFAHQQLRKFANLDKVIETAFEQLEQQEDTISDKPVDEDWTNRFINYASDVSNEEIQRLWGKVLAGEISRPESYSLRTLEFLRSVSKVEAEIINDMAKASLSMNDMAFLPGKVGDYKSDHYSKLSYRDLINLETNGLIYTQETLINLSVSRTSLTVSRASGQTYITFIYGRYSVFFDVVTELHSISIPGILLTQTANELRQLVDVNINKELLKQVKALIIERIGNQYPIKCSIFDRGQLAVRNYGRGQTVFVNFSLAKDEQEIILD